MKKRHIPNKSWKSSRISQKKGYNDNDKRWKSSRIVRGNVLRFRIFLFFFISFIFLQSFIPPSFHVVHFFISSLFFIFLHCSTFFFNLLHVSSFSFCFFLFLHFSFFFLFHVFHLLFLFLFFLFPVVRAGRQNQEKTSREVPIVKNVIFFCEI